MSSPSLRTRKLSRRHPNARIARRLLRRLSLPTAPRLPGRPEEAAPRLFHPSPPRAGTPKPIPAELYRTHLETLQRLLQMLCRKKRIPPEEAKDLMSKVHLKMIADGYLVIARWDRRSSIEVYLGTVIINVWRDHIRESKGKNRPSAAARRLGPLAVELEGLIGRGRMPLAEAFERLKPRFPELTWSGLEEIAGRVKPRPDRRFEGDEAIAGRPGREMTGEERLFHKEAIARKRQALLLMGQNLAELPDEDRRLLVSACSFGVPVARIAKSLGLPQKPLYRRIEKRLRDLRRQLEAAGIRWEDLHEILGLDDPE